jgi:hypothetical protein
VNEHTTSATESDSGELAEAQSHTVGSKVATEDATHIKRTQADEHVEMVVSVVTTSTTEDFKDIQNSLNVESKEHIHSHEHAVNWKAGIGPAGKDSAQGADAKANGGTQGLLSKAWNAVSKGAGWIFKTGGKLVRRFPIIRAGVDLVTNLWDSIKGRAFIDRGSSDTDRDSDSTKTHQQVLSGTEISDLSVVAESLTREIITNHKEELETMVASKFGTEATFGDTKDNASKKTVSHTVTTSSTHYEARRPKMRVRKLS